MLEHISTKTLKTPINMAPTDTLNVTYTDPVGNKFVLDAMKVPTYMKIDTIKFFRVEEEHDFKDGIMAILGEAQ